MLRADEVAVALDGARVVDGVGLTVERRARGWA